MKNVGDKRRLSGVTPRAAAKSYEFAKAVVRMDSVHLDDITSSQFWSLNFGEHKHRREMKKAVRSFPVLVKCILCCCCTCFMGAFNIIADKKTMQVAVGFMLGRAFYFYTVEFTGTLLVPGLDAYVTVLFYITVP